MALTHTILSALAESPLTGYDLWKRFENEFNCFWRASQQQIYRELAKMEKQGFISGQVIIQQGRPNKKEYSLTDAGMSHFLEWMGEPSEPTAIREDLGVKMKMAYLVPRQVMLKELQHRRHVHYQQLLKFKEKEQTFYSNYDKLSLQEKCSYLVLRRGIRYESDWVAWCDEAIEALSALEKE